MTNGVRIFFDLLNNIFYYLLICAVIKRHTGIKPSLKMNVVVSVLMVFYALPQNTPYNTVISFLLSLGLFISIANKQYKKIPHMFITYLIFLFLGTFIVTTSHYLIFNDLTLSSENQYYYSCKETICNALIYYIYELRTNSRKMKRMNRHYQYLFNFIIISVALTLSYLTIFIFQTQQIDSPFIPMLFSTLFLLIALCIHIYHRYIESIEKNIEAELLIEKSKLMTDYSNQIEDNLKELHSLRHDIKNHLLIIDGYATQENYSEIHNYIHRINEQFTTTPLFDTPSNVVSALLNSKYKVARKHNLDFSIDWSFSGIYVEDFHIVTILGNLIDNAITAASKCENGFIKLLIEQQESYLKIKIENNHIETISETNGNFQTTKTDTKFRHGLGIKNIRSTVEQLNGQIDINYTNEIFEVEILLPNY